jgi:methylated-DNA-[protein]-cysteine S-methyltransferase
MRQTYLISTQFGSFSLVVSNKGLYQLDFPNLRNHPSDKKQSRVKLPALVRKTKKMLSDYFKGKTIAFRKLKMDWTGYSDFEKKVLKVLSRIPPGKTLTYSGLARRVGSPKAARAVGGCMSKNRLPVILPCHRILGVGNRLGGYSGGLQWKKTLLKLENIRLFDEKH